MKRKIQGFVHGSRLRFFPMCLSYIFVGLVLGYKENDGNFSINSLLVIPIFLSLFCLTSVLNALCDFEAKIDIQETSSDRTMFDYGIKKSDIWNCVYICIFCLVSLSIIALCFFNAYQQLYGYLNILMDLFLAVYYNLQPFRLKTKLFGGEICVILFYNSILNLSFFLQTGITIWTISSTSLPRIILIVWGMLVNLYVDMEDDKKDSSTANTSAIIFGETLSKYLIIGMPIITYGLTIHYAFLSGNLYTNLALLSIPQIAEVVQLALKKQKLSKPKFFKSTLMFNFLFGIGVLIQ